nr:hypothetical protein [Streptomyces spirodelae]
MLTTPARNAINGNDLSSAVMVTVSQRRAIAYTVHHAASDRYSVVTLDGRWVIPGKDGYKARGAATRYVRTHADELVPSLPYVEPTTERDESVSVGYSLHVDANEGLSGRPGWGRGGIASRAGKLRGHVTADDAREAVARFPQCTEIHGRGTDSDKGRPSADMHCAGVTLDLDRLQGVRPGPYQGALPDGTPVVGSWGEVGRALQAWLITNRPEHVCASAESRAYAAAIFAKRDAEARADTARGAAAVQRVRTALARVQAVVNALAPVRDQLSDELDDAVYATVGRARTAAARVESANRARGFEWGARAALDADDAEGAAEDLWSFAKRSGLNLPHVRPAAPLVPADVVSDPGAVDAWESDGGACPGVEAPRAPESGCQPAPNSTGPAPDDASACVPATAEVVDYRSGGVLLRLACACGTVHGGHVPVRARGCKGQPAPYMSVVTDWDIQDALNAAGVRATADRRTWQRSVLVSSHQSPMQGFATVVPVAPAPLLAEPAPAEPTAVEPAAQPEPIAVKLPPRDPARVVLCWAEERWSMDRADWTVTASWRGHTFYVAYLRDEWFITREPMHPSDRLGTNPRKWRKTEQIRHTDRRPIRSRAEAEELMIARIEERQTLEAGVRDTIEAAGRGPAPQWKPARSIIRPHKAPPTDLTPADVVAKWGDEVTVEELPDSEQEEPRHAFDMTQSKGGASPAAPQTLAAVRQARERPAAAEKRAEELRERAERIQRAASVYYERFAGGQPSRGAPPATVREVPEPLHSGRCGSCAAGADERVPPDSERSACAASESGGCLPSRGRQGGRRGVIITAGQAPSRAGAGGQRERTAGERAPPWFTHGPHGCSATCSFTATVSGSEHERIPCRTARES